PRPDKNSLTSSFESPSWRTSFSRAKLGRSLMREGSDSRFRSNRRTAKVSAGLLMFRRRGGALEVLLVHPGGPFFHKKDEGAWSIPKGEVEPGESLLARAQLEFEEELGIRPRGPFRAMGSIRQRGGTVVHAW